MTSAPWKNEGGPYATWSMTQTLYKEGNPQGTLIAEDNPQGWNVQMKNSLPDCVFKSS